MKKIYGLLFGIGLLMLIGTAGASDLEMITGTQETVKCISGLLMVAIGFIGGELWKA